MPGPTPGRYDSVPFPELSEADEAMAVLAARNTMLRAPGAAAVLKVSVETLRDWRARRRGPRYTRYGDNGPVLYSARDLVQFMRESQARYGGPR